MGVFSGYLVMSCLAFLLLLSSNVVLFHTAGAAGLPSPTFGLSDLSPTYLSPGNLTPGYLTPGYLSPSFPRRRKRVRPCHAGRRRPQAPDGQRCLLRCLYKTCGYGECRNGKCVEN